MVRRFFTFIAKEVRGLHEAAYLIAFFTLLSQILALVRDKLLAYSFGAGGELDVYYAAFRIPDVLFATLSSIVAGSVLVPFFAEKLSDSGVDGHVKIRQFIDSLFTSLMVVFVPVVIILFFATPYILDYSMPNLMQGAYADQLVMVTRILLLQPLFFGISNFLSSLTQLKHRFFLFAISPVMYNVGIIIGILFLYPLGGVAGIACGVVIGSILHGVLHIPALVYDKLIPRTVALGKVKWEEMLKVVRTALPRTLTLSAHQISTFFLVAMASRMNAGSISIFSFAINLQSVPLTIIGASYSSAVFPSLSKMATEGKMKEFIAHMSSAFRHIAFWSFPIVVFSIVLRAQLVRLILGAGKFDWADTRLTAAALALFIVSAAAQSFILVCVRAYYARGETRKPLIMNVTSATLIVVLAYFLTWFYNAYPEVRFFFESLLRISDLGLGSTTIVMLPLAYSIGVIFNAYLHWRGIHRDFIEKAVGSECNTKENRDGLKEEENSVSSAVNNFQSVYRAGIQSLGASIIGGYFSYLVLQNTDTLFDTHTVLGVLGHGTLAGSVGVIISILVLLAIKNTEIKEIWKMLHSKIWKKGVDVIDQMPV